jgi:hypothetical protein
VRDIMKRARKALARARKSNRAADFHEWRKETKALWYALRLVGGGSRPIASATRALHSAEQWLGEDHNLVILCATLTKDCVLRERPGDIERLHDAVGRSQARLRRQAISRTRVVFAVRPRDYAARVARAYRLRDRRGPCRRA